MLRIRSQFFLQIRGVRTKRSRTHRPPYPFYFKSKGWFEHGPFYDRLWEWPERFSGWSVIPRWFPNQREPTFIDDEKCQTTGYPDASTNQFVPVEDAMPELIVPPDLDRFKLKPYVSFRTAESECNVPAITSKDLFDVCYEEQVTQWYKDGVYAKENVDSIFEREVSDKAARKKGLTEKGLPFFDDGGHYSSST